MPVGELAGRTAAISHKSHFEQMQKQEDEGKIHDALRLIPMGAFSQREQGEEGFLPHASERVLTNYVFSLFGQ